MEPLDEDAPAEVLEPGRVVGRNFRIERLLGQGAMGQVYLAEQISLSKPVAIKVLHKHLASDPALAKRFHREAKSASQLNHPNSIQIIDFGADEGGALFIAMELLDGRDLGKIIRTDFPLSLARTARIMGQVFAALDEAHVKGVIHRDLKPENIMVMDRRGEPDTVKVCDFGIAKIQDPKSDSPGSVVTMAGVVCGTPEYMSPEQARGEKLDGRSDLYSAACILYQMATGELPFIAESALGVVTRHLTEPPVPPRQRRPDLAIDPAFEALILRGLEKDRARRPESALAFKRELEAVVAGAGDAAARPAGLPVTRREAAVPIGLASTLAAHPSAVATAAELPARRGAATKVAVVTAVGVLAVVGVTAALLLGRGAPTRVAAALDAGGPPAAVAPPASQPAPPEPAPQHLAAHTQPAHAAKAPEPAKAGTLEHGKKVAEAHRGKERKAPEKPGEHAGAPAATPEKPDTPATPDVKAAVRGFKEALAEAEAALKGGKVKEAVKLFEEARRFNPGSARVHRALGKLYMGSGRIGEAKQAYKRYLELSPNASDAEFVRGILKQ